MEKAADPRPSASLAGPSARHGPVNWLGLLTLVKRGLLAVFQYPAVTLGGPLVAGLLFLAIFSITLGRTAALTDGITVLQFLAPGIVWVMLTQQTFENAAGLLIEDKLEGMIADPLMAPLAAWEVLAGYVLAAMLAGLVTGAVILAAMAPLVGLPVNNPLTVLLYGLGSAYLFAQLGVLVGLWSEKWEHFSAVETFAVLPLGILSGAFFSLDGIPEAGQGLIRLNPLFYPVDGFRGGFLGLTWSPTWAGPALLLSLGIGVTALNWRLFRRGYRMKP